MRSLSLRLVHLASYCVFAALFAGTVAKADVVSVFATGFSLPESITPVPTSFGLPGAAYIIPDPTVNESGVPTVYTIPVGGGAATPLANLSSENNFVTGGAFLPSTYGAIGGDYLAVGFGSSGGEADAIDASGNVTPVLTNIANSAFTSAIVAPAGFGAVAGALLISDEGTGNIYVLNDDGSTSVFANVGSGGAPFGMAFAPTGFGAVGGDLIVSDSASGKIYAIDPSGNVSLYTTVPLGPSQTGLRQFAFAPSGFGDFGGDLFLSISGSSQGGGTFGALVVLDGAGDQVGVIQQGVAGDGFDPRGLYFADSNTLLASSSDPIYAITPSGFVATPEPGELSMFLGMAGFALVVSRAWSSKGRRIIGFKFRRLGGR
jgi:hypothetical protein